MSEILGALFKYLMVALGVSAVVAVLYMALASNKTSDAIAGQTQLQSNIQVAYSAQGTFTTLNAARVIAGGLAPAKMVVGGNLVNPWGGAIVPAVDGANASQFTVSQANVPQDGCQKFVSSQGNAVAISVNGTALALPVDAGLAISACNAAANSILFTYAR